MDNAASRNIRLGIFVIAGLAFLITVLYMVGEKRSLFGSSIKISAQFYNVNGLMAGNNVRFSGVNVGTVESVEIISDSTVNAIIIIDDDVAKYIKKSAIAAVGTDGLMGNKLININAGASTETATIEDGDVLKTKRPFETDESLRTLNTTNENIKHITDDLKKITGKINSQNTIWSLLMDTIVADNVKEAIVNIKVTGKNAAGATADLQKILADVKKGKGTVGSLMRDTAMAESLKGTLARLNNVADTASIVMSNLDKISKKMNEGDGTVGMLVSDTGFAKDLKTTIKTINSAAEGLDENMEALKHNILLRKYFKNKAKEDKKKTGSKK
jgi:phospholipid/cholesterol/gamma-HCH transport system substrate-binding protein